MILYYIWINPKSNVKGMGMPKNKLIMYQKGNNKQKASFTK